MQISNLNTATTGKYNHDPKFGNITGLQKGFFVPQKRNVFLTVSFFFCQNQTETCKPEKDCCNTNDILAINSVDHFEIKMHLT